MGDEFAHELSRKLCLQLCSLAGYGAANDGALDILADLVKTFLRESSVTARSYAENSGRTEVNAKDIAMGLSELGYSVEELTEFEAATPAVPFGASVPAFPLKPESDDYRSFKSEKQVAVALKGRAEHTYRETALYLNKQQDEKAKAIRAHEVKKTTEDVLMKLENAEKETTKDPYVAAVLQLTAEEEETPGSPTEKRKRKMASKWSDLLLGRLQQSEEMADPTSRLAAMTSLASASSLDPHEVPHHTRRRRKERDGKGSSKEKKAKHSNTVPFSAVLKFNLQPTTQPDPVQKQEPLEPPLPTPTDVTAPLPVVKEEEMLETEDVDVFGGVEGVETNAAALEAFTAARESLPTTTPPLDPPSDNSSRAP